MLDWTEIYTGSTLFFSQTQTPQTHMVAISKVGWFVDEMVQHQLWTSTGVYSVDFKSVLHISGRYK